MQSVKGLTGVRKAAVLLASLGTEATAQILKQLSEQEIEQIVSEITKMDNIPQGMRDVVVKEAYAEISETEEDSQGGATYARKVLVQSLGEREGRRIISRIARLKGREHQFDFVQDSDIDNLTLFLQREHPQIVAVTLACLTPKQAAGVLSALPGELQLEVTARIANINKITSEMVENVREVLQRKLSSSGPSIASKTDGALMVAELLNRTSRDTERSILGNMEERIPETADRIKRYMFTFEGLTLVDDRGIQTLMRDVDTKVLTVALKGASERVREKILANMSERQREMIQEDLDIMGPVRVRDVDEAQQQILSIARDLDDAGDIIIQGRGREAEIIA